MNIPSIRMQANEWIADAKARNASYEHAESAKLASVAATILSLCDEVERLRNAHEDVPVSEPADHPAPQSDAGLSDVRDAATADR